MALRVQISPWQEAAVLRDEIARSASAVSARDDCGRESTLVDLPDSVRGAYLFRNGGREALSPLLTGRRACRLAWTTAGFVAR